MSFLDRLRNEFIDIIDWPDQGNSDILVWKFPRYDNEIKINGCRMVCINGLLRSSR